MMPRTRKHIDPHLLSFLSGRGFSMLELIVVLTLLAILSSIVVPVFAGSLASMRQDHAVRDLLATLKFAQERAVSDSSECRFYINMKKNQYWVERWTPQKDGSWAFEPLGEAFADRQRLPDGFAFGRINAVEDYDRENTFFISFYPNGSCDFAEIALVSKEDEKQPIEIETKGVLGRFSVKETR